MRNDTGTTRTTEGSRGGGHGFDERLMRLEDMSGYKVTSDDPDVRGWEVKTRDGTRIGKVDTLIIDTHELKARYIEVDLDRKALNLQSDRKITLPIGSARLDDDNDVVMLPEHSPAELSQIPASAGRLSRDDELRIRRSFDDRYSDNAQGDFYGHPHYDQGRFFAGRRRGREDRDYLTRLGEESMGDEALRQSGPTDTRRP
jgi:sporulation protein YlmC with PRC-barrel domain